jgi:N-acetylneuraminic acid mutarotase
LGRTALLYVGDVVAWKMHRNSDFPAAQFSTHGNSIAGALQSKFVTVILSGGAKFRESFRVFAV